MKTITFTGWVSVKPAESYCIGNTDVIDNFEYTVYGFKPLESCGKATVMIELDDDFDPRLQAVEELKKERTKLRAEFQNRITAIEEQINRFTALEAA